MKDFGALLETARRAEGLSQRQLADAVGVSQAAIYRYEKNSHAPDDESLERLASALGLTVQFFLGANRIEGAMAVDAHMRRQQSAKPIAWRRLEARLNMYRVHASLLYEEVSLATLNRFPTFDPVDVTPTDAARLVRMQWRMPAGPVRNLTGWLESAGCLVIEEDFATARVDGLSQWVSDHPIILANAQTSTDRKRLTLAHELGHLVLHSIDVTPHIELEANQFAAELLMPEEIIRPQLRNLSLGVLTDLKREWGTSIQALIERASSLRIISQEKRTALYRSLSSRGWRLKEPGSDELAQEVPMLTADITHAMLNRGLNRQEIATLAGWRDPERNTLFDVQERALRAVQ